MRIKILTDKLKNAGLGLGLVSVEFAEQSQFLCRVSVDFELRLLSMVLLSKSFNNVVIFLFQ